MKNYTHERNIAVTSICITLIAFGGILSIVSGHYFAGLWQLITCMWIFLCFKKDSIIDRYSDMIDENFKLMDSQHETIKHLQEVANELLRKQNQQETQPPQS